MKSGQWVRRYLEDYLQNYPENMEKMIFVAGPRQVGKTSLLSTLGEELRFKKVAYLNWDRPADQKYIRDIHYTFFKEQIANADGTKPLIILDELHKYPKWKRFLKGYYDTFRGQLDTMVTGSARLDLYRRGGDSLLGRYWLFHLYPFTLSETLGNMNPPPPEKWIAHNHRNAHRELQKLWRWGGFPEPFITASEAHHRRWVRMRRERLVTEDLRDLSRIHDLHHIQNLMDCVIASVGSTLSMNSLKQTLNVSYNAIRTWMGWLEAIYYCFRVPPYSKKIARGFKKEAKYFLHDWSEVKEESSRFENMVAVHLKKSVDFWNDTGAGGLELCFVRDHLKREVDFLILRDRKPWTLVECKLSEEEIPSSLHHMAEALGTTHNVLVNWTEAKGYYRVFKDRKYWVSGAADFLVHFV